jgi:hypothetical protein
VYPQPPHSVSQAFPQPLPQQRPARSRTVAILVPIVTVLGLLLLGMGAYVGVTVGALRGDISALKAELVRYDEKDAEEKSALEKKFADADLPRKLQAVKDLDDKAREVLLAWGEMNDADQTRNLYTLQLSQDACITAVIEYDLAAAAFPASMLNGMPAEIDLTDPSTDCLR